MLENYYQNLPLFHGICSVIVTVIEPDGVLYRDKTGQEHKIPCGTVLYSVGTKENFDEATTLFGRLQIPA